MIPTTTARVSGADVIILNVLRGLHLLAANFMRQLRNERQINPAHAL